VVTLLDVNVLVALFDPNHIHHLTAHDWFAETRGQGWVTCPLTENGLIRVLSNPRYPGRRTTVDDSAQRLRMFCESDQHQFWEDSLSVLDGSVQTPHIQGHRQVTDVYLLALAVARGGRLVTFDAAMSIAAVRNATPAHLIVLGMTERG
jgi:toxin-antitoxin system PIN domain toxin